VLFIIDIINNSKYKELGGDKVAKIRARHYLRYLFALNDTFVERYVGHKKVIRYAQGLPVYTNLLPPTCSLPFANSETTMKFRNLQHRPLPSIVNIAMTDICNAKCEHCSFFNDLDDSSKKPMSVEEIKDLIRQSANMGVSMFGFVGGEPLMHPHWREIFESVDKEKCHSVVFTNGWFLAESAADMRKAGVGGVYVSIDASQADAHDRKRGLKGLFDKAMAGVAAAKKTDLTVGFSCCIDKNGFESGELDKIIELARKHGVHEVLVFDAIPVGRFCNRDELWGFQSWVDDMIEHVRTTYNQDKKYPGVLVYAYFTSHMSLGCDAATCYCYVSPYGDICPCDFYHKKFGNLREEKLYTIWDRMTRELGTKGSNWTGCWAKQKLVVAQESDSSR